MRSSKVASVTGVMGGLVWIAAAIRGWGFDADQTLVTAGLGLLGLSTAAVGYALVKTAPGWLRLVVSICTAALCYMLWITILSAFGGKTEQVWTGLGAPATPVLAVGVLMAMLGLIGLGRKSRDLPPQPIRGGRRAAR